MGSILKVFRRSSTQLMRVGETLAETSLVVESAVDAHMRYIHNQRRLLQKSHMRDPSTNHITDEESHKDKQTSQGEGKETVIIVPQYDVFAKPHRSCFYENSTPFPPMQ